MFSSANVLINAENTWIPLPGMTYSFTTTGNAKVIVLFNVQVIAASCTGCGLTGTGIGIHVNGVLLRYWVEEIINQTNTNFSASLLVQVGAGNHTIDLRGAKFFGQGTVFAVSSGIGNNMILQIIPE